jgi:hypothetical protein
MDLDLRQLIKAKIIKHDRINDASSNSGQHVDMVVEALKKAAIMEEKNDMALFTILDEQIVYEKACEYLDFKMVQ